MTDVSDDFATLDNWTQRSDEFNTGTIEIAGGKIQVAAGNTEAAMYYSAGGAFANDQRASVIIAQASNTYSGGGPCCRMQVGSFSCYMVYVAYDNGANNLILQRYDSGSGTTLDSVTLAVDPTDKVDVEAIGTAIKGYVNDVEVLSATDATYASGYIGIEMYDAGTGNKFQIESFSGGPLAGSGPDHSVTGNDLVVVITLDVGTIEDSAPPPSTPPPAILFRQGGYDEETSWLTDVSYAGITVASSAEATPTFSETLPI